MKLGLLADIHEDVPRLRVALARLRELGADRLVVLGDVFDHGMALDETVALLADAGAFGVWGNHDAGFCLGRPIDDLADRYDERTVRFMSGLSPRLEIDGCLFTHIEPWLDPESLEDLWCYNGHPDTADRLAQSFDAAPHRLMVMGHVHRWIIGGPRGAFDWQGGSPFHFEPSGRYLVVVHAVADGWAALLDTTDNVLTPVPLDATGF